MSVEDVVLVSTVREHIRDCAIQVDSAEIPLRVLEVEQLVALGSKIPDHLRFQPHFPKSEAASPVFVRGPHESDGECSVSQVSLRFWRACKDAGTVIGLQTEEGAPGDICVRHGAGRPPALRIAVDDLTTQRQNVSAFHPLNHFQQGTY